MNGGIFDGLLLDDILLYWEQYGDFIFLLENSFILEKWRDFDGELWGIVVKSFGVIRFVKKLVICRDGFRIFKVIMFLGENGWVIYIDNGIKYIFDVIKCMFFLGNIIEKIRVGNFDCFG